jgi:hypothetical protein
MEADQRESGYFFERLDDEPTKPPFLKRNQVLYESLTELVTAIMDMFEEEEVENMLEQRDEENDGDACDSACEEYREFASKLKIKLLSTLSHFRDTSSLCAWLSESDPFEELGCHHWVNVGFATRFGGSNKKQNTDTQ